MVMNPRKGQLKIQQMMFMILAITILFVLVGLFALSISLSGVKAKAAASQDNSARLLVSKIANSPEFSCGNAFGTSLISCIDADKVMALEGSIQNYGNNFWGVQGIEIVKIYPASDSGTECTSENFPNCGKITLVSSGGGTGIANFVSLCRLAAEGNYVYPKCDLAKIIVTYQKK